MKKSKKTLPTTEKMQFYVIREEYARFLRQRYDRRVPLLKGDAYQHQKFFVGTLLEVNGFTYLAPVSSQTTITPDQAGLVFPIITRHHRVLSTVRLGYMLPVVDGMYHPLAMSREKMDTQYYNLLQEEWRYCKQHRGEIHDLAEHIYQKRTQENYKSKDESRIYRSLACDFTRLEKGAAIFRTRQQSRPQKLRHQTLTALTVTGQNFNSVAPTPCRDI